VGVDSVLHDNYQNNNSTYTCFAVEIELTQLGVDNMQEVYLSIKFKKNSLEIYLLTTIEKIIHSNWTDYLNNWAH